jgi:hypothetical protein
VSTGNRDRGGKNELRSTPVTILSNETKNRRAKLSEHRKTRAGNKRSRSVPWPKETTAAAETELGPRLHQRRTKNETSSGGTWSTGLKTECEIQSGRPRPTDRAFWARRKTLVQEKSVARKSNR